jgi:hypothetical protein
MIYFANAVLVLLDELASGVLIIIIKKVQFKLIFDALLSLPDFSQFQINSCL